MTLMRWMFGNWASRVYLTGFAGVWIWAAVTASENGGLAYIYVLAASIPGSLVYFPLANVVPEGAAGVVASACVIFGALLNAAMIGSNAARRAEARQLSAERVASGDSSVDT
jgi:hypothetical protein